MKKLTKILSCAWAMTLCAGLSLSAAAFSDMPDGEIGGALQRAVDVGLMQGVSDDLIAPNDNITRAQMAAITVRAFSAENTSPDTFNDVPSDAWYADYVSKAVAMGAFKGDEHNNFNPNANITFQETYTVLSRLFGFEPYKSSKGMVSDCDASVLDSFSDKNMIAPWAFNYAKYIAGNGGWTGINGQLKPTEPITRGEFALIMDKLVDTYVDDQASADSLKNKKPNGAVLVRKGGITIDSLNTDKNLIVTYGVRQEPLSIRNTTVKGVTLILGGTDLTPVTAPNGKTLPDESYVSISGEFYDVRVNTPYVYLNASSAKMDFYKGVEGSLVSLMIQ